MDIKWIRSKAEKEDYEFSEHAEEEREADKILIEEVEKVLLEGEIIEDYPNDPRGPSRICSGSAKMDRA